MDLVDEYRRNARECERMAEKAGNSADKASWLRLAASWLSMIRNDPRRLLGGGNGNGPRENDQAGNVQTWPPPSDEDSTASH
jgi:hypothetical protein